MKIFLKNIGKLKSADVEIKGITIIAGENNTGKSTVGKSLYSIFNSFYNVDVQIRNEKIQSIENILALIYRNATARLTSRVDFEEIAYSIINNANKFEKLEQLKDEIWKSIMQYDEYFEKNAQIEDAEELISHIYEILQITDEKFFKTVLDKNLEVEFNGQINNIFTKDEAEIKLQIKDEVIDITIRDDKVYNILTDGTVLYNDWGISVESGNNATATLKFPKVFSSRLEAPMEGEKTFTYKLDLADKKGRSFPTLTKTLTVKAPVFELTPSANGGDAFACRAFLRAKVSDGTHPDNLKFQWRKVGNGSWNNCKNHTYQTDEICDTLKNLTSGGQQYEIRAIYREKEKRVTEPIVITTENVVELEDGSFENWHKKEVYKKTIWSVGTTGLGIDQWWPYNEGGSSWWATRNALTTSQRSGVSCYYTSYSGTVPVDNGYEGKAAEISTLGWKEGNTFTELGGESGTHSAGMLFLGSHSATSNGVETIDYGHDFNVRPNAFEFYYKFKSLNSESFEAYIVVENRENGTVTQLGSGRIMSNQDQASFAPVRVNVHYTNTSLKATHMYIVFRSSTADNPSVEGVQGSLGAFDGYSDSRYVGNVLTIDNVRLIYE